MFYLVAVMPKPKYESWFMEGKLIPNYHYILIKDDYSTAIIFISSFTIYIKARYKNIDDFGLPRIRQQKYGYCPL